MRISQTWQFKRDVKRLTGRGKDLAKLRVLVGLLLAGDPLPIQIWYCLGHLLVRGLEKWKRFHRDTSAPFDSRSDGPRLEHAQFRGSPIVMALKICGSQINPDFACRTTRVDALAGTGILPASIATGWPGDRSSADKAVPRLLTSIN